MVIHQTAYARFVVAQFVERHWQGKAMRKVAAPGFTRELKGAQNADGISEDSYPVPDYIPNLKAEAAEWGGRLLWLTRGSRPDLAVVTGKLMERLGDRWTRMEDFILFRAVGYLATFPNLGIRCVIDPEELEGIVVGQRSDADLCGDTCHARSVSGFHTGLRGARRTQILIDFARRRQGATARNTADAETASLDEATHSSGMVLQEIFEQMLERPIRLIAEEDNSASISAVKRGYSRRLCYLRRTQRLSLSALHECYFGAEEQEELDVHCVDCINRLVHLAGEEMTADVLTKLLEPPKHWKMVEGMGMVAVPAERETAK
jgi:hypothetical protein